MSTKLKVAFGMAIVGMALFWGFGTLGDRIEDGSAIQNVMVCLAIFGFIVGILSTVVAGLGWVWSFMKGTLRVFMFFPVNIFAAFMAFAIALILVAFVPLASVFISFMKSR